MKHIVTPETQPEPGASESRSFFFERVPSATYRLQFNQQFRFEQAARIAGYLRRLGISDAYASPLFRATAGSTHGYDVCEFGELNPELGDSAQWDHLASELRRLGLGLVLDMVPNHMGAALTNQWWLDVLEKGQESPYARFFDINWQPASTLLKGKVLLPILEDHYENVLHSGKLKIIASCGRFWIAYHDKRLPVCAGSLPAEAANHPDRVVRDMNGSAGDRNSFSSLDALLQRQHYRLVFWREGPEEINYRRFFDIPDLVALRMERQEVFDATHKLAFTLLKSGRLTGLRVDHPDGLRDPREYFERLQARAAEIVASPPQNELGQTLGKLASTLSNLPSAPIPLFVVAEKILSGGERLPADWPVHGTTGYDFLNQLNGLFVDRENEALFTEIYQDFTGINSEFADVVLESKRQVLEQSFASDVNTLADILRKVAGSTVEGRNLSRTELRDALCMMIVAFPVYRTYIGPHAPQPSSQDRAVIERAYASARRDEKGNRLSALDLLKSILLMEEGGRTTEILDEAMEFILRFQQLTGPVMAKGMEDTAFYRYHRLISLNEVGGWPGQFGTSVEAFHEAMREKARCWPHTLLATTTHDTKRSEDARARINVLSEMPEQWRNAVLRWRRMNSGLKPVKSSRPVPTDNDEYLLYQSLVGGWPESPGESMDFHAFRERFGAFAAKAAREAKANTRWTDPNPVYEEGLQQFIRRLLDPENTEFIDDFRRFHSRVSFFGRLNSLAQVLIKCTAPGIPDFYQGTEFWDFSFVDPDNRRPVDYGMREKALEAIEQQLLGCGNQPDQAVRELLDEGSSRLKLFVIWKTLQARARHREVFDRGAYQLLEASGARARHLCAFVRASETKRGRVIVVVPRLILSLGEGREALPIGRNIWGDTSIKGASLLAGDCFQNVFTGERIELGKQTSAAKLAAADVLRTFPVALLEPL